MKKREPIDNAPEEDRDEELVVAEEREEKTGEEAPEPRLPADADALQDLNNKYVRLYAEFDNYKKRVNKDKEELVRYGNESLLYALLPAIDNLELALKHGACDPKTGVVQGVEITLKELQRTLEKFGLTRIGALGKKFDPAVHHAMTQVERGDMEEKMVAEELRAGYRYHDKVLRPSLVAVSVKPKKAKAAEAEDEYSAQNAQYNTEENIEEE
ncbi:MAG: nucleotide exchange factor GrpE [Nitrospiraceae bacterium]|nr:nucleotide exchange factor GrpE [Nitrospiraceae bacterium]